MRPTKTPPAKPFLSRPDEEAEDQEEEIPPRIAAALSAVSAYADEVEKHTAARNERAREKARESGGTPEARGPRKRHKRPVFLG